MPVVRPKNGYIRCTAENRHDTTARALRDRGAEPLRIRDREAAGQYESEEMTSPPFLVERAW